MVFKFKNLKIFFCACCLLLKLVYSRVFLVREQTASEYGGMGFALAYL